mmetsp:Transcript_159460/g.511640  ORF Transcript_159460/g.511640 Transcript_159460/m.511640 type:complete len:119 (+) Transcript_159460:790-1146(+)
MEASYGRRTWRRCCKHSVDFLTTWKAWWPWPNLNLSCWCRTARRMASQFCRIALTTHAFAVISDVKAVPASVIGFIQAVHELLATGADFECMSSKVLPGLSVHPVPGATALRRVWGAL